MARLRVTNIGRTLWIEGDKLEGGDELVARLSVEDRYSAAHNLNRRHRLMIWRSLVKDAPDEMFPFMCRIARNPLAWNQPIVKSWYGKVIPKPT
jgi:hypothetical protein